MELKTIHCFLVHPAKHEEALPDIGGTNVARKGKLFEMLKNIFDKAETECRIEIAFNHGPNGEQQNDCRDLVLAYVNSQSISNGRAIAMRLQAKTTHKSGLGLLFLMLGEAAGKSKVVISRFPADHGILAEERRQSLTVEFLEKVFMKSATAYKAAVYEGKSSSAGFWTGWAVDKQINSQGDHLAHYWIRHFLASDLKTTAAAGTRRLAIALHSALRALDDPESKAQIAAAVTLAAGLRGQTISAAEFCQRFGLDTAATQAVRQAIKHESLVGEKFQFDPEEFHNNVPLRTIELSNGGVLTADSAKFDEVFKTESVASKDGEVQITTKGRIIDQRLRRGRP